MLKHIFTFLAFAGALSFAQEAQLIKNASFEELDAKGYPKYWNNPGGNVWKSSTENAFDGKASMLYDNDIKGNYKFIVQVLPLKPGKKYEYSVMAKEIHKDGSPTNIGQAGPKIFVEYTDKDGKYMGGSYNSSCYSLNTDWMVAKGSAVIPTNIHSAHIGLLVSPNGDTKRKIWFDKVEIHEAEPQVFTCLPVTDCYRDEAFQGNVTVLIGREMVDNGIPEAAFLNSELSLILDGKTVLTAKAKDVLKDRITYEFNSDKLAPGAYTMRCSLVDPANGKTYSRENIFTRLAEKPNHRVYVDKKRRMIVDGKPFFPVGMYYMKVNEETLAPYIGTDFNCLMPYIPPRDKETLDLLQKHNLKMFFSTGHVSARSKDKEKTRATHEGGYKIIDQLKYHPTIIAWYINDELPVSFVQDAIDFRRGCEQHDPDRPTWTVLCVPDDFIAFLPASDIHGSDPYPIPEGNIANAYKWSKRSFDSTLGVKLTIQVPQAFCWGRYWKKYGYTAERTINCPQPTYEEMDAMTWMNIAGGANGLMYYSYFDLVARDKEDENLPAIPFDKTFGDIKRVASRVRQHESVLLSDGEPEAFSVTSNPNDAVCFRAYGNNGETWILAVNTTRDKDGAFELTFKRPVKYNGVSLSELDVTTSGNKLSATLKPLQPAFIRIK